MKSIVPLPSLSISEIIFLISSFFFKQPILRLYRSAFVFLVIAFLVLGFVTYCEPLSTFTAPKGGAGKIYCFAID